MCRQGGSLQRTRLHVAEPWDTCQQLGPTLSRAGGQRLVDAVYGTVTVAVVQEVAAGGQGYTTSCENTKASSARGRGCTWQDLLTHVTNPYQTQLYGLLREGKEVKMKKSMGFAKITNTSPTLIPSSGTSSTTRSLNSITTSSIANPYRRP